VVPDERYVTCGNPSCKCARGERHGPNWYFGDARPDARLAASFRREWRESAAGLKLPQAKGEDLRHHRELLRGATARGNASASKRNKMTEREGGQRAPFILQDEGATLARLPSPVIISFARACVARAVAPQQLAIDVGDLLL